MKRIAILSLAALLSLTVSCTEFDTASSPDADKAPRGIPVTELRDWSIVVAEDAIPAEQTAAAVVQEFLGKVLDTPPPIVTDAPPRARQLYIGNGAAVRKRLPGFDPEKVGSDDVRILVTDTDIVVTGGRPRGTLYAAYTFLETFLGVRFLTPDHTHIPEDAAERVIQPLDYAYAPPLGYRFVGGGVNCQNVVFTSRLKMNSNFARVPDELGGVTTQTLINHSLHSWLPYSKYGEEHPEYYCEIDGERKRLDPNGRHEVYQLQPCLTNEDVYRIVLAGVRDKLRQNPTGTVSVSQYDSMAYCQCEKCAAIDAREESHMGSLLAFVNRIADNIKDDYPEAKIGTLAYYYSRKPPKHMKPRENVIIQLCNIESCLRHAVDDPDCPMNVAFQKDMQGWGEICDNIQVWTYGVNFSAFHLPAPNLLVVDDNIRYFTDNNARGIFMDYSPYGEFSQIRDYMMGHLLWNPSLDGEALLDEFLRLHYRKSALLVREIVDRVHDAAKDRHQRCFGMGAGYGYTPALGQELIDMFAAGMAQAEDETIRARLEQLSLLAWRIRVDPMIAYYFRTRRGETVPRPSPEIWTELSPQVNTFLDLCEKYGEVRLGHGMQEPPAIREFFAKESQENQ